MDDDRLGADDARPPAGALAEPPPLPARRHALTFTGTAGEYFRIWIVNLCLSVLTLGIYSAWAKVRKKRYIYEHTFLAGESFEYRGRPLAILKGRLLAVVVVGGLYVASHFAPWWFFWAAIPAMIVGFPWLLVRTFAFNAHNSAWRNVRLRFDGGYWRCLRIFVVYGLVTVFTLGLGYPYLKTRLTEFIVRHHAYGATRFDVENLKKSFFSSYGKLYGMALLGGIALTALAGTIGAAFGAYPGSPVLIALEVLTYVMYIGLFAYIRARVLNATFEHASLGTIRFDSWLGARALFKLYIVNIVAIIATLGLATPWAVIRTLRYRASCFAVIETGGLDGLPAAAGADERASGEEIAEMMDVDFSL